MKKLLAIALSLAALTPALAQPSVGVSIGINQPGVYGRINLGNFPPPQLVYPQPVLIAPPARYVQRPPVYLYVPAGHQKNWRKHCGRYNACGQPVYFVKEQWVRDRYDEHRRGNPHRGRDDGRDHHPGHGNGRHDNGGYYR